MKLPLVLATNIAVLSTPLTSSFSAKPFLSSTPPISTNNAIASDILILDHININHERDRHDLVKSFYFDFLQCAIDPRKHENYIKGSKTLWANIGSQQFHLPEGQPHAQKFDGAVTLTYPSLEPLLERYQTVLPALRNSQFSLTRQRDDELRVTDPWGTTFYLRSDPDRASADERGSQPGESSEGLAVTELIVDAPQGSNFAGIGRFYGHVLGAPATSVTDTFCTIAVGTRQTLTFRESPDGADVRHEDLVEDEENGTMMNYGAHVSIYVRNLKEAYRRAEGLGVTYVNTRFKRRAWNLDEAVEDCMFRILDIVDPADEKREVILRLEHEVRSVVKVDGGMYKSCPFDEIPEGCI